MREPEAILDEERSVSLDSLSDKRRVLVVVVLCCEDDDDAAYDFD